jgi:hypothetical protein
LPLRGLTSLYKESVHPIIIQRTERGQRPNPISCVSCVSSVVLMGRETGSLQPLAPLLLTEGKGADLVIRGNVVLNTCKIWNPECFSGDGRRTAGPPWVSARPRAPQHMGPSD